MLVEFIERNLFEIVSGGCLLIVLVASTSATIKLTLRGLIATTNSHSTKLENHGERISSLETQQAERRGYERGLADAKRQLEREAP